MFETILRRTRAKPSDDPTRRCQTGIRVDPVKVLLPSYETDIAALHVSPITKYIRLFVCVCMRTSLTHEGIGCVDSWWQNASLVRICGSKGPKTLRR